MAHHVVWREFAIRHLAIHSSTETRKIEPNLCQVQMTVFAHKRLCYSLQHLSRNLVATAPQSCRLAQLDGHPRHGSLHAIVAFHTYQRRCITTKTTVGIECHEATHLRIVAFEKCRSFALLLLLCCCREG